MKKIPESFVDTKNHMTRDCLRIKYVISYLFTTA